MNVKPLREIIEAPLNHTFRAYCHDYPFPYSSWHHHPEYEIHLIRKSSGLCYIGTYAGPFSPGNLMMTGPNLPHSWVTDDRGQEQRNEDNRIIERDLVLQFGAGFAEKCVSDFSDCASLTTLLDESRSGIEFSPSVARRAAEMMHALLDVTGPGRLSLFLGIVGLLVGDEERKTLSLQGPDYQCTQPKRLESALLFIARNYNRPDLTCREIAEREGMTLSAFSRFFERHLRCTCLEYVNRLRIYKACQLLLETDERITSISFEVGYDTLSTFNRNFMRLIGISPSAFRIERKIVPITAHYTGKK